MIYRSSILRRGGEGFFKPESRKPQHRTLNSEIDYFHKLKIRMEKEVRGSGQSDQSNNGEGINTPEKEILRKNALKSMKKSLRKALKRNKKYNSCLSRKVEFPNQSSPGRRFSVRSIPSTMSSKTTNTLKSKTQAPPLLFLVENSNGQKNDRETRSSGFLTKMKKSPRLRAMKMKKKIRRFSVPNQMYRRFGRRKNPTIDVHFPHPELLKVKLDPFKRKSFLPTGLFQTFVAKKEVRKKKRKKRRFEKIPSKSSLSNGVRIRKPRKRKKNGRTKKRRRYAWDSIKKEGNISGNELKGLNRNIYGRTVVLYQDKNFQVFKNGLDDRIRRSTSKMSGRKF